MKKYYKKVFSFLFIFFYICIFISAQEIRLGISGVTQGFIDSEDVLFYNATGGSFCAEISFNGIIGESVRIQYVKLFSKEKLITSAQQFDFLAGFWGRLPFIHPGLFLQPSIEAGLVYQMVELGGESEMPEKSYTDLLFQLGLGFHFVPEKLLNGSIDFEITPVYTFIPMSGKAFQCGGARIGVAYIFK